GRGCARRRPRRWRHGLVDHQRLGVELHRVLVGIALKGDVAQADVLDHGLLLADAVPALDDVALRAHRHQHLALGALRDDPDELELGVAVVGCHELVVSRTLLCRAGVGRRRAQDLLKRIAAVLGIEVALAERVADPVPLGARLAVAALGKLQAVAVLGAARRLGIALAVLGIARLVGDRTGDAILDAPLGRELGPGRAAGWTRWHPRGRRLVRRRGAAIVTAARDGQREHEPAPRAAAKQEPDHGYSPPFSRSLPAARRVPAGGVGAGALGSGGGGVTGTAGATGRPPGGWPAAGRFSWRYVTAMNFAVRARFLASGLISAR